MWRHGFTILRKVVFPSVKESTAITKLLYSTKGRLPKSTAKLTIISASLGVLIGAGYGGYTHYKINLKKPSGPTENEDYPLLSELPKFQTHYKVSKIVKYLKMLI